MHCVLPIDTGMWLQGTVIFTDTTYPKFTQQAKVQGQLPPRHYVWQPDAPVRVLVTNLVDQATGARCCCCCCCCCQRVQPITVMHVSRQHWLSACCPACSTAPALLAADLAWFWTAADG